MNVIKLLASLTAFLIAAAAAQAAAGDISFIQLDASGKPVKVSISPAANSLLGFDVNKGIINLTSGSTVSLGTVNATSLVPEAITWGTTVLPKANGGLGESVAASNGVPSFAGGTLSFAGSSTVGQAAWSLTTCS